MDNDMIDLKLTDGQIRSVPKGSTPHDVATGISSSLAKKSVYAVVEGIEFDMTRPMMSGGTFELITQDDPRALNLLRHDMAHIFAEAIKSLYPSTQITIGPAIENGFYYDIYNEDKTFTQDDFKDIEDKMRQIVASNTPFIRHVWTRSEAIAYFKSIGEDFKVELIESIPDGEDLSIYQQGDFFDLCRGPHLPSTGRIGVHFKLMKVAGAYWRANAKGPMLQRIYGTGFWTKDQLEQHLHQLEEAQKRDHRKLGQDLGLFHIQEEAVGSVFWHPKGWTLYLLIEDYMRKKQQEHGYVEVRTPQLVDRSLWEASGHWDKFGANMFVVQDNDQCLAIKPMNCPCHVQIFKKGLKSYRDLPLRMAEFGSCHRNESSGSIHGIMRTRAFTQDDAHIFCSVDQIISETQSFCAFLKDVYSDFGFHDIVVKFSDRPETRAGSDAVWDQAEAALKNAATLSGLDFVMNPGEGAFYGPKLEFVLKDCLGRDWQLGTLQVDFVLPERLGATFVNKDGNKEQPVMLHRAILGSFERFIGILIEHYGGKLPLWLAPVQVVVAPLTSNFLHYAAEVCDRLKRHGIRYTIDDRSEKISYKVREHSLQKIPMIVVVGAKEQESQTLSVRFLGDSQDHSMSMNEFLGQCFFLPS